MIGIDQFDTSERVNTSSQTLLEGEGRVGVKKANPYAIDLGGGSNVPPKNSTCGYLENSP